MATVRPHGTFKNGFDLLDAAGRELGSFHGSAWRERGEINTGGEATRFRRDGGRRFALDGPGGGELAAAHKPSIWSGRWVLQAGGQTYELAKRSWLSRSYELRRGGRVVGSAQPKGAFSGKAAVDLPAELPPAVQVFVVAVVLTLWRRESGAAGAGAAAASGGAASAGAG
jgi:hypothetical protein